MIGARGDWGEGSAHGSHADFGGKRLSGCRVEFRAKAYTEPGLAWTREDDFPLPPSGFQLPCGPLLEPIDVGPPAQARPSGRAGRPGRVSVGGPPGSGAACRQKTTRCAKLISPTSGINFFKGAALPQYRRFWPWVKTRIPWLTLVT